MRSPNDEMTEKELDTEVRKLAKLCHWKYYHTYRSKRSPAGFPDVFLARPPRVVIAELKTEKKQPTPEQMEWLQLLGGCPGLEVYLWRPSDLEEIASVLSPRQ